MMNKNNRNTSKIPFIVVGIILIACMIIFLVVTNYKNIFARDLKKADSSVSSAQKNNGAQTSEKHFDENNIGEVYCAPIDEEHIAEDGSGAMYSDNEILVVSKDGVAKSEMEALADKYNAEIVGRIEQTGDYQLKLAKTYTLEELDELADEISNEDIVLSANTNYLFAINDSAEINYDIYIGDKWIENILKNATSILANDKAWNIKAINAYDAWYAMNLQKENIDPVKVGLIDTGFDIDHEDLGFAEVFYDDNKNGVDIEDKSHGTHVAGIMAARGDNKEGICGIYPYANGRLYGASWQGAESYSENLSSIMDEKICFSELILRNVKVINCSYGYTLSLSYNNESIKTNTRKAANFLSDYLQRLLDKGYDFVIVTSAGNDSDDYVINLSYDEKNEKYKVDNENKTISYDANGQPAKVEKDSSGNYCYIESDSKGNKTIYKVTGVTSNEQVFHPLDDVTDTSNKHLDCEYVNLLTAITTDNIKNRIIAVGAVNKDLKICNYSNAGRRVDIFAPGGDEKQKIYSSLSGNIKYGYKMGTSMAAPHVAGVAADIWSIDNSLTGEQIKKIVCGSTLDNIVVCEEGNEKKGVIDCSKAVQKAYEALDDAEKVKEQPENSAVLCWVVSKDNEDKRIANAEVTAVSADTSEEYTTVTDKFGHFELIMPKGEYEITVNAEEYDTYNFDLSIKNNGEVIYPDWIKLKPKETKAEKYARIVMENEDIWLDPLNGMPLSESEGVTCWFEDVDFDGDSEFIVGGCNMQTQGGVNYCIYKFSGEKMIKILGDYMDSENAELTTNSTGNIPSQFISPNSGFSKYGAEIVKDSNGDHRYIFPYIISYIGEGYGIAEMRINDNKLTWSLIGGFSDYPDLKYYDSSGTVSKNKMTASMKGWFSGSTYCISKIGIIPCTYVSKKLDSEWYNNAINSDTGLINSSYVSGCYDTLTKKEKKAALVRSYESYSIEEIGGGSQLYERFLSDLKSKSSSSDPDADSVYKYPGTSDLKFSKESDLPDLNNISQEYYVVYREGYRKDRIEICVFDAEEGDYVYWKKSEIMRSVGLSDIDHMKNVQKFYYDEDTFSWVSFDDNYKYITDKTKEILFSNIKIVEK